jgi:hypothetical protein
MSFFKRTQSALERADHKAIEKANAKQEQEKMKEMIAMNPNARFPPTQVFYADPSFAEPPPLNYTLKSRYKALAIFWGLVFIDCICMPLVLYFVLWYKTSLSPNAGKNIINRDSTELTWMISIQH